MNLDKFKADIAGIVMSDDPERLLRASRDMTEPFSPILSHEMKGKLAELVVVPDTKEDVIRTVAAAITTLEATAPNVVIIDSVHGGSDPGAIQ